MAGDPDPLGKLSDSIADAEAIDWESICAKANDPESRRLLENLRIVANVAEVHRAQNAETLAASASSPQILTTTAPLPAARWGHLLLIRKIGEGAFGEVYEALDTWLDHPRALKLLKPEVANRTSAPQILHEARKLVRVRHPNVVMVHGADSHDGRLGFWMDLIEGQTLEQRVQAGRLSAGEATYVGQELCRALAAVHLANLLHRDIKAQNVMRSSDGGRIILMDFGAGEFRDAPTTGRPLGTPLYLAPELLTGGPATIQSDIYALGVLLYYLVSGRFPIEGQTLTDLVLAHAQGARRHLRDARPDLPDGFVSTVQRAIDATPAKRFPSAGDFYAALEAHGAAVPTPLPPPPRLAERLTLERRLIATVIAVVGLFVLIEALGFVAARTFEVAMHVDSEFALNPGAYFRVGREGILPFAILWSGCLAVVAVLIALRVVLRSQVEPLITPCARFLERLPAPNLGAMIPLAGGIAWALMLWTHRALFSALGALRATTGENAPEAAALGEWFFNTQVRLSNHSAWLSFLLVFAVVRWFPRIEQRAGDDLLTVQRVKWATVALALVIVATSIAPRRIAFDRFEMVLYENRLSFVIASKGEELLLYAADRLDTARRRVRGSEVVRTKMTRKLTER